MEKLSKSLKDGGKLAVGESYQDLVSSIHDDNPVIYRHSDKRSSRSRQQRPKSLNFEIFLSEQEENKTDDEKIEHVNGELRNGKPESPSHEVTSKLSKLSQEEESELNNDAVKVNGNK